MSPGLCMLTLASPQPVYVFFVISLVEYPPNDLSTRRPIFILIYGKYRSPFGKLDTVMILIIRLGVSRVRQTCFTKQTFPNHRYRLLGTRNMSSITTHPSLRKVLTESRYFS